MSWSEEDERKLEKLTNKIKRLESQKLNAKEDQRRKEVFDRAKAEICQLFDSGFVIEVTTEIDNQVNFVMGNHRSEGQRTIILRLARGK